MITKFNFKDKTIKSYAIRKLTPKECFRLMGVRDAVICIMQQTVDGIVRPLINKFKPFKRNGEQKTWESTAMKVSASQQYKQAGNSIVVDVLAYIYEQLWFPKKPKQEAQLSMFDAFFPEDILPEMPNHDMGGVKHILTTFSGYDSQLMACDVLKEKHPEFKWDCIGWSDIDKYACQMHDMVFPKYADKALGDITKINWHKVKESLNGEEVELFTYSSPCTDISQAGKQMGLEEGSGTRSALLWNVSDAIDVLRPKYLLQENVAALVSEKFMPDFRKWLKRLESLGYVNRYAILNSKNYGVPQNRDRVFVLSMRKDVAFDYKFPEPFPLTTRLEDILEEEVEERFFLKDDAVSKFLKANDKDSALFVQFDLKPNHENAMFLKTWLQWLMNENNGWEMKPTELESLIEQNRNLFTQLYEDFKEGKFASKKFAEQFIENITRDRKTNKSISYEEIVTGYPDIAEEEYEKYEDYLAQLNIFDYKAVCSAIKYIKAA